VTRVVLDANVLASGLINPNGAPGRILAAFFADPSLVPIATPDILKEIRRVLHYPRIQKQADLTDAQCDGFVEKFEGIAWMVKDRRGEKIAADPDDDKYLLAAREGLAQYIVSGDRHLLDVRLYEGVRIVSPREFLEILDVEVG